MDPRSFYALAAGALINSALYVAGVFIFAILNHNQVAAVLAIATVGLNFLAYTVQIAMSPQSPPGARIIALALVAWSIVTGILAGFALIVW
jgi:hypothetical protein